MARCEFIWHVYVLWNFETLSGKFCRMSMSSLEKKTHQFSLLKLYRGTLTELYLTMYGIKHRYTYIFISLSGRGGRWHDKTPRVSVTLIRHSKYQTRSLMTYQNDWKNLEVSKPAKTGWLECRFFMTQLRSVLNLSYK